MLKYKRKGRWQHFFKVKNDGKHQASRSYRNCNPFESLNRSPTPQLASLYWLGFNSAFKTQIWPTSAPSCHLVLILFSRPCRHRQLSFMKTSARHMYCASHVTTCTSNYFRAQLQGDTGNVWKYYGDGSVLTTGLCKTWTLDWRRQYNWSGIGSLCGYCVQSVAPGLLVHVRCFLMADRTCSSSCK